MCHQLRSDILLMLNLPLMFADVRSSVRMFANFGSLWMFGDVEYSLYVFDVIWMFAAICAIRSNAAKGARLISTQSVEAGPYHLAVRASHTLAVSLLHQYAPAHTTTRTHSCPTSSPPPLSLLLSASLSLPLVPSSSSPSPSCPCPYPSPSSSHSPSTLLPLPPPTYPYPSFSLQSLPPAPSSPFPFSPSTALPPFSSPFPLPIGLPSSLLWQAHSSSPTSCGGRSEPLTRTGT